MAVLPSGRDISTNGPIRAMRAPAGIRRRFSGLSGLTAAAAARIRSLQRAGRSTGPVDHIPIGTAYLGYDLTVPAQQRQWQANEPMLNNTVTQTYNTWRAQGATQVEQALAAVDTSINNAVAQALQGAQAAVADANRLASNLGGPGWFMTLALPTNWYDPAAAPNFTQLTLKSAYLTKTADSRFDSYSAGASWGAGLWSVGGKSAGSFGSQNSHMDAQNLELSAKVGVVRILRPWLHEFIFRMQGWFTNAARKGGISNGALQGNQSGLLPLIPTALVVARDIEIKADFSTEDTSHIEKSISAEVRVGWGPFSISGGYAHSDSHDSLRSALDGGTLKVPGIQVVAWISEIVPASPPLDAT